MGKPMKKLALSAAILVALPVFGDTTFVEDVAPILQENCVSCHKPGGIAPMSFTSWEEIRPWGPLISYKVENREMPPYAYDSHIGVQDLEGDWRLSSEEIGVISDWASNDFAYGNPDTSYEFTTSEDSWNFPGEPDLIISSVPIDVPSSGNDLWHKHIVSSGLTEDRCIAAVQVRPRADAASVVHHANSRIVGGGMLTEYAMGKYGESAPSDVCRLIPAGAEIEWDIHLYPGGLRTSGVIEDNVVEIGIWFHDNLDAPRQDLRLYRLGNQDDIVIPPHGTYMTQGFHSFDHDVLLHSWQPHGHLRMVAASIELFHPDGTLEPISQVSNWSATWHHNHIYSEPILVPAGTVFVLKQWYDNTSENPNNPDPDQWVYGGSRTGDEMTHNWIALTHLE